KEIRSLGANRISFGVQSFNEKKLKLLTRIHNSNEAKEAIERAYSNGFENISLDLMYSTAIDTKEILKSEIEIASKLPISHISAYSLTLEEDSSFYNKKEKQSENLEHSSFFIEEVNKHFFQYEISNFGKHSLHNKGYWKYKQYIGVGAGAVGRVGNKRYYPPTSLKEYINNPLQKEVETLTKEDMRSERIFLGLRSCVGIKKEIFTEKELEKVNLLIRENKLEEKNDIVYNTDFLLSDEIALWIDSD
ncbi:MAG: radical SAM family heme chaperone HemW, partial [Campylobacterales bacterium]|nr:radical SAM family heme chaperone HemW [Campylobacterales bacterium]